MGIPTFACWTMEGAGEKGSHCNELCQALHLQKACGPGSPYCTLCQEVRKIVGLGTQCTQVIGTRGCLGLGSVLLFLMSRGDSSGWWARGLCLRATFVCPSSRSVGALSA